MRRSSLFLRPMLAASLLISPVASAVVRAQSAAGVADQAPAAPAQPAPQHKYNPYGSPLDTLLSTRLWADVPPAEKFVREARPDPGTLDYKPLTGSDPVRPKPRDPAGVAALQAELEAGIGKNEARAKRLKPKKSTAAKKATAKK